MAWILYQILPVATPGGHNGETEIWALYYDVFVRHAFGNYRNVLKEVSHTIETIYTKQHVDPYTNTRSILFHTDFV